VLQDKVALAALGSGSAADQVARIPAEWQKAELAVDGPTLGFILGDKPMQHKLAVLAAHCSGVVVSRSSPSQKAAIVKMMTKYEMWKAAGAKRGLRRWYAMHKRRLQVRGAVGDGAGPMGGWLGPVAVIGRGSMVKHLLPGKPIRSKGQIWRVGCPF